MVVRTVDLANPFLPSLDGVCEILLVRHGEQAYSENMALGDGMNPPLSDLGKRQAEAVGERLSQGAIDAVYCSTLERAASTGAAIANRHGIEPIGMDEIVEFDMWRDLPQDKGLLDSIGKDELRAIYREGNRTRRWDAYVYGEPRDEFRARVIGAVDKIAANHHGDRVVVACHGGVITTYLSHLFGSPHDQVVSVHHTSITTVRAMGKLRRVIAVNDYHHVLAFQDEINPLNVV